MENCSIDFDWDSLDTLDVSSGGVLPRHYLKGLCRMRQNQIMPSAMLRALVRQGFVVAVCGLILCWSFGQVAQPLLTQLTQPRSSKQEGPSRSEDDLESGEANYTYLAASRKSLRKKRRKIRRVRFCMGTQFPAFGERCRQGNIHRSKIRHLSLPLLSVPQGSSNHLGVPIRC